MLCSLHFKLRRKEELKNKVIGIIFFKDFIKLTLALNLELNAIEDI